MVVGKPAAHRQQQKITSRKSGCSSPSRIEEVVPQINTAAGLPCSAQRIPRHFQTGTDLKHISSIEASRCKDSGAVDRRRPKSDSRWNRHLHMFCEGSDREHVPPQDANACGGESHGPSWGKAQAAR